MQYLSVNNCPYALEEVPLKKAAYAQALLRAPDALKAARAIEKTESNVYWLMTHWRDDAEVQALMSALALAEGPKAELPTKDEMALEMITEARDIAKHMKNGKELALRYYELATKIMGYVDKPGMVNNGTINNTKTAVFVVPEPTRDALSWEQRAQAHQMKLVSDVG